MRAVIAYLLAPVAGLLVFVGVWASPLVAYARPDADFLGLIWAMVGGIVVPAFAVVLALSLGVMFLVRARFRGAWWASAGGGMALYLAAFALLALDVGFARVFANPYWLTGLLLGGLVHGLAFRALVGAGRPARGTGGQRVMRVALTILVPPLAGLAAFAAVWMAPYLAGAPLPHGAPSLGALFAAWAIPVYPLALVLGLPVLAGALMAPRWAGAITLAGMLAIYAAAFALIGVAWVGVATLLGGMPQWLALGAAAVVHTLAYLGLRPRELASPGRG